MKRISKKIPGMIGLLISLLSFALVIAAFIVGANEQPPTIGVSESFALWTFSVMAAMLGLVFYVIDAYYAIGQALNKCDPIFNTLLAVISFGGIPMGVGIGGRLGINILIWNLYHLLMFILELISIVRHIKSCRNKKCCPD